MKFRTFRILAALAGLALLVGTCTVVKNAISSGPTKPVPVAATPATMPPAPAPAPPRAYAPPPAVPVQPPAPAARALSTAEIRTVLEGWLTAHADRGGKQQLKDILPDQPFRATALRFPEPNASKWSDSPAQWSQIKLDLDRNGKDDEKWLLKNGHTYKREVLDQSGATIETEYFK